MFRTSPVHHQERFLQAVFADLVCGNTRTTRHVQPVQSCRKFLQLVYLFGLHIYYELVCLLVIFCKLVYGPVIVRVEVQVFFYA